MTISSNVSKQTFLGDGATTIFPYPFRIFEPENIKVILTNPDGDLTELFSGFRVDADTSAVEYPYPSGSPLPLGWQLTLLRKLPITQETSLPNQGPFFARTVENMVDRSRAIDQQLKEELSRCIKFPEGKTPDDEEVDATEYIKIVQESADSAAQSAGDAAESAANAKESELNAKESELNAKESELNAANFANPPWDLDSNGDLTPALVFTNSDRWRMDENGDITPEYFPAEEMVRNIVPQENGLSSVGTKEKFWAEGYFYAMYGNLAGTFQGYNADDFLQAIISVNDGLQVEVVARESADNGLWDSLNTHTGDKNNPHNATKAQVGLESADNTADIDKPVSNPQKIYIDNQDAATLANAKNYTDSHANNKLNPHETDKSQIGLSNVDNVQQASKAEFEANKLTVQAEIGRVETIAKGASRAFVFSTYQQLTNWLNGSYTRPDWIVKNDLRTGDNLYIVDRDVPDYWWDGAQIQELETQKVSLADYPKTAEVQALLAVEVASLQTQINNKEPSIASGTVASFVSGAKTLRDLATDVRAVVLTGLSTAINAAIAATDSVLTALGKLQAQITAHRGARGTAEHGLGDGTNAGFSTNDYTSAEKTKVAGIAANANNYAHPANHPPSIITQDTNNRFVTDAEKTAWNAKQGATGNATTSAAGLMSSTDKSKLDGIAAGANAYVHPTGDGNLHVPATGTANNGKVLKAGSTAGSLSWGTLTAADVGAAAATHNQDAGTITTGILPIARGGTGNATGNAATATKLAAAKKINGVAFDGSADITVADSTKAPLASPAFTGTPTAPTAATATNNTQLATTAFVKNNMFMELDANGDLMPIA